MRGKVLGILVMLFVLSAVFAFARPAPSAASVVDHLDVTQDRSGRSGPGIEVLIDIRLNTPTPKHILVDTLRSGNDDMPQ